MDRSLRVLRGGGGQGSYKATGVPPPAFPHSQSHTCFLLARSSSCEDGAEAKGNYLSQAEGQGPGCSSRSRGGYGPEEGNAWVLTAGWPRLPVHPPPASNARRKDRVSPSSPRLTNPAGRIIGPEREEPGGRCGFAGGHGPIPPPPCLWEALNCWSLYFAHPL